MTSQERVAPAKAGAQSESHETWVPACAGTTTTWDPACVGTTKNWVPVCAGTTTWVPGLRRDDGRTER